MAKDALSYSFYTLLSTWCYVYWVSVLISWVFFVCGVFFSGVFAALCLIDYRILPHGDLWKLLPYDVYASTSLLLQKLGNQPVS